MAYVTKRYVQSGLTQRLLNKFTVVVVDLEYGWNERFDGSYLRSVSRPDETRLLGFGLLAEILL